MMFLNKLVCSLSLCFIIVVTFTQAKGLKKRFFLNSECYFQECLECKCSHLENHKDRRDGTEGCEHHCDHDLCEHKHYDDICAKWNALGKTLWNNWESWNSCSKSCGGGTMSRTRTCLYFGSCTGNSIDTKSCNNATCSVDGGWSPWQNVSSCSVTCETGFIMQVRFCDNPSPSNGGQDCQGDTYQRFPCSLSSCPAKSVWINATTCSVTCGQGHLVQTKNCTDGNNCQLGRIYNRLVNCSEAPCPVDGGWSSWKDISTCSHICGNGTKIQTRHCDSPKPDNGGHDCAGARTQFISCNSQPCPVNQNNTISSNVTHGGTPLSTSQPGTNTTKQNITSMVTGGVTSTSGNIHMVGVTGHSLSASKTSLSPVAQNTSTWVTVMNGQSTSRNQSINQNISSNITHGGTRFSTSQQGPNTTTQSITSMVMGGATSTSGNIHMVGVTGHSVSASKTSLSPVAQNTPSWVTVMNVASASPSLTPSLSSTTQISSTRASTTQASTPTITPPLSSTTKISSTKASTTQASTPAPTTHLKSATQKASTAAPTTTTQINAGPTSCFLCSGPPYICEVMYHQEQCQDGSHQYCINKMTNNRDGTRLLERRCATKSECEIDWWQNTSDRSECTNYDITQAEFRVFECSYCCSGPNCNEHLMPKNLYRGKH